MFAESLCVNAFMSAENHGVHRSQKFPEMTTLHTMSARSPFSWRSRVVKFAFALVLSLSCDAATPAAHAETNSRLRVIIETDAGGDPDDEQSLVRFLLYANEWEVEGIIANRARARDGENHNRERTGPGIVRALVRTYGECWTNLVQHDARYPRPETLLKRTVAGDDSTEDAMKLIIAAVDRDDPRPVWYADWGSDHGSSTNNLHRALDRVLRERGDRGYATFKNRLRIICHRDMFGDHTARAPGWKLWVNTFEPPVAGKRWYHRFSAITARAGGFDLQRDALTGHGPLGAHYPVNTTHTQKEGDSGTFLYLVPTGMNDPEQPTWGSWAGRYGLREDAAGRPFYWANQPDTWNGTTHRDNSLARWAVPLQNDFRARLDWCVKPFTEANHPPRVSLNGDASREILRLHTKPGAMLKLDASASRDPDGQPLHFEWIHYPEPGTYRDTVEVSAESSACTVRVPKDAAGKNFHLLLTVTDEGTPPLTRYRRVVVEVSDAASAWRNIKPFFHPSAEFAIATASLRSPLLFADGTSVRNATDWPRRRAEILNEWHTLMGPWPKVIEQPKVEMLSETNREFFTQRRVRVEIAPGQMSEGWLLLPEGAGPFPAALVVYYEPETSAGLNSKQPFRDYGLQLTRRGFVTLSIGTPGGNAWKPEMGTTLCQPLSFHAYVAANCWHVLANLPQVDRTRIGVVGHSYGGKWALFAGALWEKFTLVAVSDPGIVFDETRPNVNYWEPWYLGLEAGRTRRAGIPTAENPRTGAYRTMIERGRDLHELHALIAPRPFLVSGGAEDPVSRWTALNHAVAVNQLLGQTNRVAMTNRKEHSPDEESNARLYDFFEHFLQKPR
jgi:hypothetical protein